MIDESCERAATGRAVARVQPGRHRRGIRLRWLLLLLFAVGYASTFEAFRFNGAEYFVLSLVSAIACAVLLSRLDAPAKSTFHIWLLLLVFCAGYYAQFFLLAVNPRIYQGLLLTPANTSEAALMAAYRTTTLAFLAFCLTAWALLACRGRKAAVVREPLVRVTVGSARSACTFLLVAILLLEALTAYVAWQSRIAVMGAQAGTLPYRMAGAIFYTRLIILPGLLLLLVWLSDRCRLRILFRAALCVLLVHACADAVLRSSRGTVITALVGLFFLLLLSRAMTRRRLAWIAAGFTVSLLLFPVLTSYRNARIADPSQIAAPLRAGFSRTYSPETADETATNTAYALFFRVTGMASLVPAAASGTAPLGIENASRVTLYFNRSILGIPATWMNSVAPSLVGWFYIVAGDVGVCLGIAAFILLAHMIWQILGSARILSQPVAQSLFLMLLLLVSTDGVLESSLWTILGSVISIAAAELTLKSFCIVDRGTSARFTRSRLAAAAERTTGFRTRNAPACTGTEP